jgi:hypothetical protein
LPAKTCPKSGAPSVTAFVLASFRRTWRPDLFRTGGRPSITEYSLRALLRSPHETMPHITFTPDQMDDIIEYILALKPRQ